MSGGGNSGVSLNEITNVSISGKTIILKLLQTITYIATLEKIVFTCGNKLGFTSGNVDDSLITTIHKSTIGKYVFTSRKSILYKSKYVLTSEKIGFHYWHCVKSFEIPSFFGRIFLHSDWIRRDTLSVFSPNARKCGPEETPYLNTFHYWKTSSYQIYYHFYHFLYWNH